MIRKLFFLIVLIAFATGARAQQQAQFTQFMYNQLYYNPAYAGVRGMPSFTVLYRNQWMGFQGAPISKLLSFNTPVFGNRVGIGITAFNQSTGIFNIWEGIMAYSYHIKINENSSFRFGMQGEITHFGIDFSDPSVIVRDSNDPSIREDKFVSEYRGNFGVGIHLQLKQMFIGLSVPSFFPSQIGFNTNPEVAKTAEEATHYYFMTGIMLPISRTVQIKPVLLAKYVDGAPLSMDVNLSFVFNLVFTAGVSYRFGGLAGGDSFDLLALYQLKKLAIGMAYDIPTSEIKEYTSGSLEVLLRYDFIKETTDMANPRFFF